MITDDLRARRPVAPIAAAAHVAAADPSPEEVVLTDEAGCTVLALLTLLPSDQRQILELRLAGLTGPEIAAALGRSLGAVKIAQVRAFARLRATLDPADSPAGEGRRAMSLDRGTADRLNDHLDAVVTGETTRSLDLDPSLATTVERFFAADDAPGPPSGLADHLWEELLLQTAPREQLPPRLTVRPERNGHLPQESLPTPLPRRRLARPRWALPELASAALVLLTLIGSCIALRSPLGQEERPASIPAIDATLEAVTLVEAQVSDWPTGGPPFFASIFRITVDPGVVDEVDAVVNTTGEDLELFTVESGQLTVEADGPVIVTRGTADRLVEPTTVPAGTIVLDAGDTLFVPTGVTFRRRNDTETPASILEFQIADLELLLRPPGVRYQRLMPDKVLNVSLSTPAEIALQRLRLLPGRTVAIQDLPGLQILFVEEGTLDLMGARRPANWCL